MSNRLRGVKREMATFLAGAVASLFGFAVGSFGWATSDPVLVLGGLAVWAGGAWLATAVLP